MSNCLAVVVLIFIDFAYFKNFEPNPQSFFLFLTIGKANPHTPIAEAANIQYLNCLTHAQSAKC